MMEHLFVVSLVDMKTGSKQYWDGASLTNDISRAWRGSRDAAEKEAKDAQKYGVSARDYQYKVGVEAAV